MSDAGKGALSPWYDGDPLEGSEGEVPGYLEGARAYADRYGTLAQNSRLFGTIGVLSLLLASVAVGFALWLAHQPKAVPYVVAVDKIGRAVAVAPASRATSVDERVVRGEVGRVFFLLRTMVGDDAAQKVFVNWVYEFLPKGSPAFNRVSEWYRETYEKRREGRVEVDVVSIDRVPRSDDYIVEMVERTLDASGAVAKEERLTGYATVTVDPTRMFEQGEANPLGIFITELSVVKQPGSEK